MRDGGSARAGVSVSAGASESTNRCVRDGVSERICGTASDSEEEARDPDLRGGGGPGFHQLHLAGSVCQSSRSWDGVCVINAFNSIDREP